MSEVCAAKKRPISKHFPGENTDREHIGALVAGLVTELLGGRIRRAFRLLLPHRDPRGDLRRDGLENARHAIAANEHVVRRERTQHVVLMEMQARLERVDRDAGDDRGRDRLAPNTSEPKHGAERLRLLVLAHERELRPCSDDVERSRNRWVPDPLRALSSLEDEARRSFVDIARDVDATNQHNVAGIVTARRLRQPYGPEEAFVQLAQQLE